MSIIVDHSKEMCMKWEFYEVTFLGTLTANEPIYKLFSCTNEKIERLLQARFKEHLQWQFAFLTRKLLSLNTEKILFKSKTI